MKKLKTILQYNSLYIFILLFTLMFSLLITLIPTYKSKYKGKENNFTCIIKEYKTDGNKLELNLKCKEKLIGNYYFKSEAEKATLTKTIQIGDKVKITGTLETPKNNTVPFLFNYKKYLYNQQIYYILNIENIKIKNKTTNILYKLKNLAYEKANKIKNNEYIYAYILGKTYKINNKVLNSYRTNGISHLFALSGLHVGVFSIILMNILKKLKIKETSRYIFVFIFLIIFSFITGFSPSILRASLLFFLIGINKTLKLKIKTINILYLTFSILVLINPFIIYNLSFILSFTSTFFIVISNSLINDKKYIKGLLKVSTLSFISNIGLSIYYFNSINPLGIIMNLIFVPLISYIIFPLTIITYIFPFTNSVLSNITKIMELLSIHLSKYSLTIYFSQITLISLFLYYIILTITIKLKKIKYIFIIIIIIIIWKIKPYLNTSTIIYFIDVGQGDSALIISPHNKKTILIDTGGLITYKKEKWTERINDYSIALDTLIPLMHKIGVEKIDYLFITHGDQDHGGEAKKLIDNFKINKVYINNGEVNELEKNIKNKTKIDFEYIKIDNIELYSLNNKIYNNENDNSIVLLAIIEEYKILLMADASEKVEKEITNNYNLNNVDILKVGHHGSKTSTSKNFINIINPLYSVISVGKNNKYHHPNKETLDNLINSKTYRTDIDGSIVFNINNKKLKIKNYAP